MKWLYASLTSCALLLSGLAFWLGSRKRSQGSSPGPWATLEAFEDLKTWVQAQRRALEEEWTETWERMQHHTSRLAQRDLKQRKRESGASQPEEVMPATDDEIRAQIMRDAVAKGTLVGHNKNPAA